MAASSGPFSDCLRKASLSYDTEPCNNNMDSAYANGFPVIAESLRVGILRTSATKGNIFLAWRCESWLDECLEFGPSTGHSQRPKAFATRGQRSCCLKASMSGGGGLCGLCLDFNLPCPHYNWKNHGIPRSLQPTCVGHCLLSIWLPFYMQRFLVCYFHSLWAVIFWSALRL